jgi:hypothetical protein
MSILNCFRLPTRYKKQTDQDVERLVDEMLSLTTEFMEKRYGKDAYKKIFIHFARIVLTELILMLDSIISQINEQENKHTNRECNKRIRKSKQVFLNPTCHNTIMVW